MTRARADRQTAVDQLGRAPALRTTDLTVTYGDFVAVDRVSLSAERGEVLGLLGPNGAGKTSFIRALTTIVSASGGTASVNGHALEDKAGIRSSIGVLPESNGYPGSQTARSYLRFYGQLFGMDRATADTRAARLLDVMGLSDNFDRIATFSRGMRQRLGLCRALMNEPAVLFLDEPTLGLDPAGRQDMLTILTSLAVDDGTCVVLCSHLLDEVERVCDRVAIMHRARIVAEGGVDDIIAKSGVGGRARLTVGADELLTVDAVLARSSAATSIRYDNSRPGTIDFDLATTPGARGEVLRGLLEAGIEPRSFDLKGAQLSTAFLALTGEDRAVAS